MRVDFRCLGAWGWWGVLWRSGLPFGFFEWRSLSSSSSSMSLGDGDRLDLGDESQGEPSV